MPPQTTLADVERAKAKTEQLIARIHGARTTQELREIWRGEVQPFLVSPLMFERGLDSLLQYLTEARDKRQAELSKMYLEESTARWHADSENRKRRELEGSKRLSRRRESNLGTTADVIGRPGWFGESQRHSEAASRGKGDTSAPIERTSSRGKKKGPKLGHLTIRAIPGGMQIYDRDHDISVAAGSIKEGRELIREILLDRERFRR